MMILKCIYLLFNLDQTRAFCLDKHKFRAMNGIGAFNQGQHFECWNSQL